MGIVMKNLVRLAMFEYKDYEEVYSKWKSRVAFSAGTPD
jgi:hypothetical protein